MNPKPDSRAWALYLYTFAASSSASVFPSVRWGGAEQDVVTSQLSDPTSFGLGLLDGDHMRKKK